MNNNYYLCATVGWFLYIFSNIWRIHTNSSKLVAKNMSYQGHCRLKKALKILYMCHGFVSTQRDDLLDSWTSVTPPGRMYYVWCISLGYIHLFTEWMEDHSKLYVKDSLISTTERPRCREKERMIPVCRHRGQCECVWRVGLVTLGFIIDE